MIKSRIPLENFVKEYSVRNKLNEDIPVYSVTNSQGFCTEYFSKEVASQDKTTYKIVPRGYFAYNPSRINVGSVDWQKYEDRVIVSPLYNVFSVSDEIDCQYLYYFFRSNIGRQMIKAKSSGSVRDNLKIEMLKEMTIPDISMREQQFCSSVLDKLQILIKLKCDEIKQMDELVKARFVEMFVDRGYPVKTIGDVIDRKITRVAKAFDKTDVIQYLDISSIDSSSKTVKKLTRYILAEAPSRAQYVLKYNDIMYSTVRPNLQNVAINTCSEENVVGSTGFCILRCIGVTVGYMWGVMNSISFTEAMTNQATGASYPAVTDKVVYSYKIPIPPKEEQIVYEQLVRQIAKSKSVIEKSLKELETLQASLMQKYFS